MNRHMAKAARPTRRWVFGFGDGTWPYSSGQTTLTGWIKAPYPTPVRDIDFDVATVMQTVIDSITGQPCKTIHCYLAQDAAEDVPGCGYAHALVDSTDHDLRFYAGNQPLLQGHIGEEWYYGLAFRTNAAYVPNSDGSGMWNALTDWHARQFTDPPGGAVIDGIAGQSSVGMMVTTVGWPGWTVGSHHDGSNVAWEALPEPHIMVMSSGGNADKDTSHILIPDSDITWTYIMGPPLNPGSLHRVYWHIKWSGNKDGIYEVWIDDQLLYSNFATDTLWRRSDFSYYDSPYPQFENYRSTGGDHGNNNVYYGGIIKGLSLPDVRIPVTIDVGIDYEQGTVGNDILSTDAGDPNHIDMRGVDGSATLKYDNVHGAVSGVKTAKHSLVAAGDSQSCWYFTTQLGGSHDEQWGRMYVYLTENPPLNPLTLVAPTLTGNLCFRIQVNINGTLTIGDQTHVNRVSSSETVPLNQWFRIEWHAFFAASPDGIVDLEYFLTEPHELIPTNTISMTGYGTLAAPDGQAFGIQETQGAAYSMWTDAVGLSWSGYPGPAV